MKISSSLLVFTISPILSIFHILRDIYNNKIIGYVLASLFFFLLSYLYIPSDGGDKSYYIKLYYYFSTIEFSEGVLYIKDKLDDFTLYFLLLIFSQLGISHSLFFGLITGTTVCILFVIFYNSIVEFKVSKFSTIFFFFILICSISLPAFFSGIRFYFALSFLVFGFYQLFKENNTMFGLFSMIFATTIHYSITALVIPSIIFILLRRNLNLLKFSYLASLPLIASPEVILSLLSYLPFQDFDPRYIFKVISYTGAKEFVVTNSGHAIYIFFGKLWYFLISLYVIFNIRRNQNQWFAPLLIMMTISNLVFSFPWIFNRFSYITLIVFVYVIVNDYKTYSRNNFFAISYLIICMITTSLDILIQRDNFKASYARYAVLSTPTALMIDPMDGRTFDKGRL